MPRPIIFKAHKIKDKEKFLKEARGGQTKPYPKKNKDKNYI